MYSTELCTKVVYVLVVIPWIAILLRMYTRYFVVQSFAWDDGIALAAMIISTFQIAFFILAMQHGVGAPLADLMAGKFPPKELSLGFQYYFATLLMSVGTGTFIKISFALTLIRITASRLHKIALYVVMVVVTIATLIQFAFAIASCEPVNAFWKLPLDPNAGKCGNAGSLGSAIAQGMVTVIADILIGIVIPTHLLYGIQMQMRLKITAWLILALGSLASIATLLRVIYEIEGLRMKNTEMDHLKAYLWYLIEVGVSLICTSAATLKPLLVAWKVIDPSKNSKSSTRDLRPVAEDDHDIPLARIEEAKVYHFRSVHAVPSSTKSMRADRKEDPESDLDEAREARGSWLGQDADRKVSD